MGPSRIVANSNAPGKSRDNSAKERRLITALAQLVSDKGNVALICMFGRSLCREMAHLRRRIRDRIPTIFPTGQDGESNHER